MDKEERTKRYLAAKKRLGGEPFSISSIEDFKHLSSDPEILYIYTLIGEYTSDRYIKAKLISLLRDLQANYKSRIQDSYLSASAAQTELSDVARESKSKDKTIEVLQRAIMLLENTIIEKNERIKKLNEFSRSEIIDLDDAPLPSSGEDYVADEADVVPPLDVEEEEDELGNYDIEEDGWENYVTDELGDLDEDEFE